MENGKNIKHTSRHCGRGPAIQAVNKENTLINELDPGSMSGMTTKKAFTLVELLVVVLIIGILSAIAIPMYQGAVDKSHWSTMLPGAKAIKDAEEAIKMTNGAYTDNMANLDVTMNNADLTFNLVTPNNTADPNVIRVTNSKLNNVRLASYLDDNPVMGGQLHCEALKNDERANKLCGKLLMGQELTEQDGYVGYLLDQDIDKATCDGASRSWSSSKTRCYKNDTERCTDLGNMGVLSEGQCGFENGKNREIGAEGICVGTESSYYDGACAGSIIHAGGMCVGESGVSCNNITVEKGGVCIPKVAGSVCSYASNFKGGTAICNKGGYCGFWSGFDGGVCVGIKGGCVASTFKNGAICYAHSNGSCANVSDSDGWRISYQDTSCCCGSYCPSYAPKCDASRCDPYYMEPNNFKDL